MCLRESELTAPAAVGAELAGAPTRHRAGAAGAVGGLLLVLGFSSPEA